MKRLRAVWESMWVDVDRRVRVGRILGLTFIAAGFIAIGKAWEGSASVNFPQGQIPYLLSGGFMGLGLIVSGCTLLVLSTVRSERKNLTEQFEHMATLLGRNLSRLQPSANGSGTEDVVAGEGAYHRAGCRILFGKDGLMTITVEQAHAEGLDRCRLCDPPAAQPGEDQRSERKTSPVTAFGQK